MKVAFCIPSTTFDGPYKPCAQSLENCLPAVEAAGWEHCIAQEVGNPYISAARAQMTRRALDAKADVFVYIDHDVSWRPEDMVTLLNAEGDVIAGTYRFKNDKEEYMGQLIAQDDGTPVVRADGCLKAALAPAGFLKVTRKALVWLAKSYPELMYGDPFSPEIDMFNHGAQGGIWWGEDYAFCQRWSKCGGEIWTPPDMNINHHTKDAVFEGNLHKFLMRQPGGSDYVPPPEGVSV